MYLPYYSLQAECDIRPIFKQSLTGLNSEVSVFQTGFHTKVKEPSLSYYLPLHRENPWIHTSHKGVSLGCEFS